MSGSSTQPACSQFAVYANVRMSVCACTRAHAAHHVYVCMCVEGAEVLSIGTALM